MVIILLSGWKAAVRSSKAVYKQVLCQNQHPAENSSSSDICSLLSYNGTWSRMNHAKYEPNEETKKMALQR